MLSGSPPSVAAMELWCGSAGGISDTAPPVQGTPLVCAVQGCKMMDNWGKCDFMFSCCQSSKSHALIETEGSCSHTWAKTEKKEQVSYFTEALKKHLVML